MFIELTSYTSLKKKLIEEIKPHIFKFADIICMKKTLPVYFVLLVLL